MKKKQNSVERYITRIQTELMKEFGRLDLPLRLRVHVRNLALKEGLSPTNLLQREVDRYGSVRAFDSTQKKSTKIKREERRVRRDANCTVSTYGIFGEKIIGNTIPVQGGAPGLGKSARRLRGFKE